MSQLHLEIQKFTQTLEDYLQSKTAESLKNCEEQFETLCPQIWDDSDFLKSYIGPIQNDLHKPSIKGKTDTMACIMSYTRRCAVGFGPNFGKDGEALLELFNRWLELNN